MLSKFLIVDGLVSFMSCAPPVILCLKGPQQVNPIFRRNATKIYIPVVDLLFIFLVGRFPGITGGFMVILVPPCRRKEKIGGVQISHACVKRTQGYPY